MKTSINLLTVIIVVLTLSFSSYAKGNQKGHKVLVKVTKLEGKNITFIKPRKENNLEHTVSITDETTIEIDGKKASFSDIKVGMSLIIDVIGKKGEDKTAFSIVEVKKRKKKK